MNPDGPHKTILNSQFTKITFLESWAKTLLGRFARNVKFMLKKF